MKRSLIFVRNLAFLPKTQKQDFRKYYPTFLEKLPPHHKFINVTYRCWAPFS